MDQEVDQLPPCGRGSGSPNRPPTSPRASLRSSGTPTSPAGRAPSSVPAQLADAYGVTDIDVSRPDCWGYLDACGRDTLAAVNVHFPAAGRWHFTINRLVAGEGTGVSDVTVTDRVRVDRAISFFELRDGRIWRVTECWPEDGEAPEWRSRWAETANSG